MQEARPRDGQLAEESNFEHEDSNPHPPPSINPRRGPTIPLPFLARQVMHAVSPDMYSPPQDRLMRPLVRHLHLVVREPPARRFDAASPFQPITAVSGGGPNASRPLVPGRRPNHRLSNFWDVRAPLSSFPYPRRIVRLKTHEELFQLVLEMKVCISATMSLTV